MESEVATLEREFAAWLGASGALAFGFGRGALQLALEAAGVSGGEVAVPDFICAQVAEAVRRAGARPVFYRVGRNLSVAAENFLAALHQATRAAVVAHWFGRVSAETGVLAAICRERGIALVEDCALALGATDARAQRAGAVGDFAVFSFTKSDWCFGGGMVVARTAELAAALRRVQEGALGEGKLRSAPSLLLRYGILRRVDFAANRPRWTRLAGRAGGPLEWLLGFRGGNFYDAGRFDVLIAGFAACRARRLLAGLDEQMGLRRPIVAQLSDVLRGSEHILPRRELEPGDTGAFLLLQSPAGRAEQWVERADQQGVTLRRCWPAYQPYEPGQESEDLDWLAQHLVIFDVHPQLKPREIERVARLFKELASEE
jgi:dTDP-4-amino-4,6-dideoxygalactose transaminase